MWFSDSCEVSQGEKEGEYSMNNAALIERLQDIDTAALCDADKGIRVMDIGIRPISSRQKMVGIARTVRCREDFLTVIKALADAEQNDVLVIDDGGGPRAVFGELFATEAQRKNLAGIVIDGACRDIRTLQRMDFSIYARFVSPMAGTTTRIFETQTPVVCGGVSVAPGEIIIGDQDGIVVLSSDEMASIIEKAKTIQQTEKKALKRMAAGESLIDMLNFRDHFHKRQNGQDSVLQFII
jgi:RraA family protein